jgi:hypothetical protein
MMRDYCIRAMSSYPIKPLRAVILLPHLYDKAKAMGVDMSGYIRQEPIPPIKSVNQNKPKLSLKR